MELFFAPLTCALAARISFDEAAIVPTYVEVDRATKRILATGEDYLAVNPLGYVPALRLDDGTRITEITAILQYIADACPQAGLAPPPEDLLARAKLREWLSFLNGELHKGLMTPLVNRSTPAEVRAWTVKRYLGALDHANAALEGREYLLDRFGVADAYLIVALGWTSAAPEIDLAKYPNLVAYRDRLRKRPSVAAGLAIEIPLFRAEMARLKAA
jgi:glutathione S-transferase